MLERITSYKLPDGTAHSDKETAAAKWLQSLANAGWDYELPIEIAKRMIEQRNKIIQLLLMLDEVESD